RLPRLRAAGMVAQDLEDVGDAEGLLAAPDGPSLGARQPPGVGDEAQLLIADEGEAELVRPRPLRDAREIAPPGRRGRDPHADRILLQGEEVEALLLVESAEDGRGDLRDEVVVVLLRHGEELGAGGAGEELLRAGPREAAVGQRDGEGVLAERDLELL